MLFRNLSSHQTVLGKVCAHPCIFQRIDAVSAVVLDFLCPRGDGDNIVLVFIRKPRMDQRCHGRMDQHRQHLDVWRTAVNDEKNKILRISERGKERHGFQRSFWYNIWVSLNAEEL